jgi:hypothetical protein
VTSLSVREADPDLLPALIDAGCGGSLETLGVGQARGGSGSQLLAELGRLTVPNLGALSLARCQPDRGIPQRFVDWDGLRQVRTLMWIESGLQARHLRDLFERTQFEQLENLHLRGNRLGREAAAVLVETELPSRLEWIVLLDNPIRASQVRRAKAQSARLRRCSIEVGRLARHGFGTEFV